MKHTKFLMALVIAVVVVGSAGAPAAFAKTTEHSHTAPTNNVKPGWGYGDKNHEHSGPPGYSVRPSDRPGDNIGDDGNKQESLASIFSQFSHALNNFFHHFG